MLANHSQGGGRRKNVMKGPIHRNTLILGSILCALLWSAPVWAVDSFTATYRGQGSSGTCGTTYNMNGREPSAAGLYPVFLYMVGTSESYTNASSTAAIVGMANRGYVAASIQYRSSSFGSCSTISNKARCIFDSIRTDSAVTTLCNRAKADCTKGIVVGGFSQGSIIADLAKNYDARVQAAFGMGNGVTYVFYNLTSCVGNGNRALPSDHLRVVNGQSDSFGTGNISQLQTLTGFNCGSTAFSCLQSNGSGWYRVRGNQVQDGTADHCYMRASGGCSGSQNSNDAGWANGADVWELNANLDWLSGFTQH